MTFELLPLPGRSARRRFVPLKYRRAPFAIAAAAAIGGRQSATWTLFAIRAAAARTRTLMRARGARNLPTKQESGPGRPDGQ